MAWAYHTARVCVSVDWRRGAPERRHRSDACFKPVLPSCIKNYPDETGALAALICQSKRGIPAKQLKFMGNMPVDEARFGGKKIQDYIGWEKSGYNVTIEHAVIDLYLAWQEYDNA